MKTDTSKVNTLNDLSLTYKNIDCLKGLEYGKQALSISKKLDWSDGIANSYNSIGVNYFAKSQYVEAEKCYNNVLKITKNKKAISTALRNTGAIYTSQGDYAKGLKYCFQALKISEAAKDKKNISRTFSNIGSNYFYLKKYEKAIAYGQKALQLDEQLEDNIGIALNSANIGQTYQLLGQKDKAFEYYKKSLAINTKLGNKLSLTNNLSSIAAYYLYIKKYPEALRYGEKALASAKSIDNLDLIAINSSINSDVYFGMAKSTTDINKRKELLNQARVNCIHALNIHKKTNDQLELYNDYSQLSHIDEFIGNASIALDSYKLAISYKDSIYNADNKETIKNLEDKRTIELRDKQIQLNRLTIESKEKQKWYFIFGILSLGIIGSLLFYQSRNRRKTNEKLQLLNAELDQANKTKTRFFSILNHDLRSPVSNLIHFLHLQKENPELLDDESKKRMENKTISGAENLLNSMEDILLWSKGQMENFEPKLKAIAVQTIFEDIQNHFASEERVQIRFENYDNISIHTDENYVKTIIRNLTGNAIKALAKIENPSIVWKAWQENGNSYLSVTDNGLGGTQEQFKALYDENEVVGIQSGLGLHLIRDLAKAVDCSIAVDSKPNEGTTFILSFT
ncbi:tetratricopeptide repeat-containing sensor histidine kinase [Flavobacterium sp.]|uniref:tetratricopeptide repeat-containing sensor histidine kinase n=1 Tax=Flavobacterium sp. TaxID=239 RepID=UPI00286BBA0E|nr:tetratricopeptide repeat-containing sensor histidine kinase [Flavobacterium sp.]